MLKIIISEKQDAEMPRVVSSDSPRFPNVANPRLLRQEVIPTTVSVTRRKGGLTFWICVGRLVLTIDLDWP
ncbi:MAG: hypothetical protein LBV63_03885 [Candidatus Methanoplasma sp.]|nr:hypothetical protein [Candidatus Methanoplasma sp.]